AAFNKIDAALKDLKSGKGFEEVAEQYSDDEEVKNNKGKIGYLTVFSLPYQMENIVYSISAGSFSNPYRSKNGYHIFKVNSERPALGRIKASQILFLFSPTANDDDKKLVAAKADSVYNLIRKGLSWEEAVMSFSQDRNTMYVNGVLPEFGIGEYEPAFEAAAFALQKTNDISKPFATSYGYHIIRLNEKIAAEKDFQKATASGALRQKVMNDYRAKIAKNKFNSDILKLIPAKKMVVDENALWQFTDSFLTYNNFKSIGGINENTLLFSFPKENVKASDWARYVRSIKAAGTPESQKGFKGIMEDYVLATTLEYYRNHLEEYNDDFKYQLQEFKDGNLLFEVMEKNVWNKASADSIGQKKYYTLHKPNYKWQSSVAAILITASDKLTADDFKTDLLRDYKEWRKNAEESGGKVIVDSGRFEKNQIPSGEKNTFRKGEITTPVINEQDGSASFAYITELYPDNQQRSFEEAKGMVINDYQTVLEEKWINALKIKYPVKINDAVWNDILNGK
ncbi:MAG: peptidylprolyl isomerase, partial [Bacteroidota bacterium]